MWQDNDITINVDDYIRSLRKGQFDNLSIKGDKMTKYGQAAIMAADWLGKGLLSDPVEAWNKAVQKVFPDSLSSQKKGCPKDTFLGLCQYGHVKGVKSGHYTKSIKNIEYAIKGLEEIKLNPEFGNYPAKLWKKIAPQPKIHNSQMHIVTALLNNGYIQA